MDDEVPRLVVVFHVDKICWGDLIIRWERVGLGDFLPDGVAFRHDVCLHLRLPELKVNTIEHTGFGRIPIHI